MTDAIIVLTTTATKDDAERIAQELVGRKLAACIQILGPMTSIYRWEGAVQREEEYLCLLKTRHARYGELEAAIKELHSYDTPEILAIPAYDGSAAYIDWINRETA